MKLDTVRNELWKLLEEFHKGRGPTAIDPDLLEDSIWFLDLLRKTQGYDVERPVRREQRRAPPGIDPATVEELLRAYSSRFEFRNSWKSASWKSAWEEAFNAEEEYRWNQDEQPSQGKRAWHEVLGVRPDSTAPQRLKAYRALAMRYHPDRPGGSNEKMQELNQAKREAGI